MSGSQSTPRGRRLGLVAVIVGAVAGAVGVAWMSVQAVDHGRHVPAAAAEPVTSSSGSMPSAATGPPSAAAPTTASGSRAATAPKQRAGSAQPVTIKVPDRGSGTYHRAKLKLAAPDGHGRVIRFDVRVERGLKLDPETVAREIHETLSDRRSWRGTSDHVRFQLVSDPAKARLHAYVVTPDTTDRLCYPWLTRGEVSCQNGNRVVLNAKRWVFGAKSYGPDVASYREYLVNHEFGHALGYRHVGCPGKGRRAPVMMQQTKGLNRCRPNPWPAVAR